MRDNNLVLRAHIVRAIRAFFEARGFLEVETPLLIPANAPEEHIEPFRVGDYFLQTSPELCMKRLLCLGHDRLFQISRCWRNGERGSRHLPEFTMLEWYRANSNYSELMSDCEDLLRYVSESLIESNTICYNKKHIVIDNVFERISVRDAFQRWSDISMEDAVKNGSFDEIVVTRIEAALEQTSSPVMLTDYPIEMAALARPKPGDASVAERFELYAGGLELANGFSELNDPVEQRMRFLEANRKREENGYPALPIPEPFLRELASMPPSAGIALGVDRLVMLLADARRIDEVIAFTPESL
jgi:lysyl-tRNA synthetase class 2